MAEAKLSHIHEHSDRTTAELLVKSLAPGAPGHLHQASINLLSTASRQKFAQQLSSRRNDADWGAIVEQICVLSLAELRKGALVHLVSASQPLQEQQYLLDPIIPIGNPTIFFGEGGTGKSHLALIFALIVEIPWPDNPLFLFPVKKDSPTRGLYLDWEMGEDDFRRRLKYLATGCNLPAAAINYRECTMPLADDIDRIQESLLDISGEYLVIDSVAGAAGGDILSAETAMRFFGALRQLHTTSIIIAHTAKNSETKKRTPFGSVFFWNYARSIWEIATQQEEGTDTLEIGLYHRKSNVSGLHKPFGIKFNFDYLRTHISLSDIRDSPVLLERATVKIRILELLKEDALPVEKIAEALDIKEGYVRKELSLLKSEGKVVKVSKGYGLTYHDVTG